MAVFIGVRFTYYVVLVKIYFLRAVWVRDWSKFEITLPPLSPLGVAIIFYAPCTKLRDILLLKWNCNIKELVYTNLNKFLSKDVMSSKAQQLKIMNFQVAQFNSGPIMAIEEKHVVTTNNMSNILGLDSRFGTSTEIQPGQSMNHIYSFEPRKNVGYSPYSCHLVLKHNDKLKLVDKNFSNYCQEVNYDQCLSHYTDFGNDLHPMFWIDNRENPNFTKWTPNKMSNRKLTEGNDGLCHISQNSSSASRATENSEKIGSFWELSRSYIIRRPINFKVLGSSITYDSETKDLNLLNIDLKVTGSCLEDVLNPPWSYHEVLEGRRFIRVERFQHGSALHVHFLVVHDHMRSMQGGMSDLSSYLEVACIRFDHADGDTTNYFVTSVDVIKIIELLIANNTFNSATKWKERGRIRSNLAPLWFKNWSDLRPMHLHFEDHIRRFSSRKSYQMSKYTRLLPWVNLGYALSKAMLFYCLCSPKEAYPPSSSNSDS